MSMSVKVENNLHSPVSQVNANAVKVATAEPANNACSDLQIKHEKSHAEECSFSQYPMLSNRGDSISTLLPDMANLQLSNAAANENCECLLAGYIKAVIPPTGIVVIQLAMGSEILDVGSAIFTEKLGSDDNNTAKKEYQEIGVISDIFGSICEPMYSLQLNQGVDCLKVDSKVFYMLNHPSTRYVSIKQEANNRYSVVYKSD